MTDPTTPVVAVIDDDSVYQFTANRTLKATQLAHQVLQFTNGQDALSFITSHVSEVNKLPDIIFLDINMPITDGWEFLDEYRKIKKAISKPIRIYMVSSSIDPRDINRAKDNPEVIEYVEKPVSLSKFSELLRAFGID